VGHVALYLRISKDRNGRAEGVAIQERQGRRYAVAQWPDLPIEVYSDNDITAADRDVYRPGYEKLRDAIRRGDVEQLWAVEQSRLERTEVGWFNLAAELVAGGVEALHTKRDGIVYAQDTVAGIKAVLNAGEVRTLRKRVNDALDERAADGRPPGGTAFGYTRFVAPGEFATVEVDGKKHKTLLIVPEQAEAAQWSAEALLDGKSLTTVVNELRARGVPTARGGAWELATVRSMLLSPTIAGLRVHRGEVIGRGNWEPILDETTWRQVRAVLQTPTVTVTDPRGRPVEASRRRLRAARRYLLTSGLARCGRCGAALIAQQRRGRTPGSRPGYFCHSSRGGCNGIGILAEPLEEHVVEFALRWATSPEVIKAKDAARVRADEEGRDLLGDLALIEQRQHRAEDRLVDGTLDKPAYDRQARRLRDERRDVERRLARIRADGPTYRSHIEEVRARWGELTIEEQRRVMTDLLRVVVIRPAKPGTRRFDPDRVAIAPVWPGPGERELEPKTVAEWAQVERDYLDLMFEETRRSLDPAV
jgi:site-specific DNA recombinase